MCLFITIQKHLWGAIHRSCAHSVLGEWSFHPTTNSESISISPISSPSCAQPQFQAPTQLHSPFHTKCTVIIYRINLTSDTNHPIYLAVYSTYDDQTILLRPCNKLATIISSRAIDINSEASAAPSPATTIYDAEKPAQPSALHQHVACALLSEAKTRHSLHLNDPSYASALIAWSRG